MNLILCETNKFILFILYFLLRYNCQPINDQIFFKYEKMKKLKLAKFNNNFI